MRHRPRGGSAWRSDFPATSSGEWVLTRVLHWLTAALVMIHRTLGVTTLVVVLVRLVNRLAHRAPPLPSTVGTLERKIVVLSELSQLFWLLRQAHSVVAYALMAVIAAHVSAILLHTLTLRDRMIERMTFGFGPNYDRTP